MGTSQVLIGLGQISNRSSYLQNRIHHVTNGACQPTWKKLWASALASDSGAQATLLLITQPTPNAGIHSRWGTFLASINLASSIKLYKLSTATEDCWCGPTKLEKTLSVGSSQLFGSPEYPDLNYPTHAKCRYSFKVRYVFGAHLSSIGLK